MKIRRSFSSGSDGTGALSLARLINGRPKRLLAAAAGLFGVFLVIGYLFAATLVFPAPLIVHSKSIPRVIGADTTNARTTLSTAGFNVRTVESVTHPSAARGTVVWQDPPPSVVAPEGSTVEVSVSAGPQRVSLPDVTGFELGLAQMLIEKAGLIVARVERAQTAAPRGVAVNTRPPAGSFLLPGSGVTLVVSQGAPTITIPNLVGLTPDSARAALEDAGLQLGVESRRTVPSAQAGSIIQQNPGAGTLAAPGIAVDVVIARERRL